MPFSFSARGNAARGGGIATRAAVLGAGTLQKVEVEVRTWFPPDVSDSIPLQMTQTAWVQPWFLRRREKRISQPSTILPFAYEYLLFSPVGFKGNLSLLEICLFFPGVLAKWKIRSAFF